MCHRPKVFTVATKQQGYYSKSLTLVTIGFLTVNYTIVSKIYEHKSVDLQLMCYKKINDE